MKFTLHRHPPHPNLYNKVVVDRGSAETQNREPSGENGLLKANSNRGASAIEMEHRLTPQDSAFRVKGNEGGVAASSK